MNLYIKLSDLILYRIIFQLSELSSYYQIKQENYRKKRAISHTSVSLFGMM